MAQKLISEVIGDGRVREWWKEDGKTTVTTSVDIEPLVEANKRAFNDAPEKFGNQTFHEVARIDGATIERLAKANNMTFADLMSPTNPEAAAVWSRFLNDRDTRAFRTRPGRVVMKAR